MYYDQHEYKFRFEWGLQGIKNLAPISDVLVIVDVLSFTTSVDIAVSRGGTVFPFGGDLDRATDYAATVDAILASPGRSKASISLSPGSMLQITPGSRIVLPSPNGATLSLTVSGRPVLAGCLRNAAAIARVAQQNGERIAIIGAGERWKEDASLRPALEDLLGAGAIISHLNGDLSPEAQSAVSVFNNVKHKLKETIEHCSSGKELIGRGYKEDVILAAQHNVSDSVPVLLNKAFGSSQN